MQPFPSAASLMNSNTTQSNATSKSKPSSFVGTFAKSRHSSSVQYNNIQPESNKQHYLKSDLLGKVVQNKNNDIKNIV